MSISNIVKAFGTGFADAVVGDVKSIVNGVKSVINQPEQIYNTIKSEVISCINDISGYITNTVTNTVVGIYEGIKQGVSDFKEADSEGRAYTLGGITEKVAVTVVTTKVSVSAAKKISGISEGKKVVKTSSITGSTKAASRSIKITSNGSIRLEKGVESVNRSIQKKLGVKISGSIQKPCHLVINGKEIPLNPLNPNWRYFRK